MVRIVHADASDVEAIAVLLHELDTFYGATDVRAPRERAPLIRDELFGPEPAAHALLAWADDECVGLAAYSYLWPAARGTRSLYLKELYVRETARNQGVGDTLMHHLYRIAVDTGCSRVEWTTDADNPAARGFYERMGVKELTTKICYRVEGQDLLTHSAPGGTAHHDVPRKQ